MVKIIDYFRRRKAIRKITGNQGFVVETEDKIICYIQKKKCRLEDWRSISERYSSFFTYCIDCSDYKDKYRKLVEKYNLDKKVVYVLEGLVFNAHVSITGGDSDLEIRNCKFNKNLEISIFGNCIIRSTHIQPGDISPIVDIRAEDDVLMDGVSISHIGDNTNTYWGRVLIVAPNLVAIKNSKITMGNITLARGNECIDIINSLFTAFNMSLWSKKIKSQSSKVIANNELKVKTENFEGLTVKTPKILFNDQLLPHRDGTKEFLLRPPNVKERLIGTVIGQFKKLCAAKQPILNGERCACDNPQPPSYYKR